MLIKGTEDLRIQKTMAAIKVFIRLYHAFSLRGRHYFLAFSMNLKKGRVGP